MRWLAVVLCLCLTPALAAVTLVEDGRPVAEIVVPEGAPQSVGLAAKELAAFVERSSGAALPIVASPSAGTPHVYLGANEWSAAAGVTPAGLKPEGFHLKTVGDDLHIVGEDNAGRGDRIARSGVVRTGTLHGVYELLERALGVRFYWHDELGTLVPQHRTVTLPDFDETQAPHWRYRTLPYGPEKAAFELHGRRLKLGLTHDMSHGHNWHQILPPDEYGAEHPEYFAMVGGERLARHYSEHHGGQVCTTNPDVIDIFAQKAIAFFDEHPDRTMFSISPNDGGGFCECEQCRALDVEMWGDEIPGVPVMTDRILTFYNAIAEKVAEKHPDKYLGSYVYSYYKKPPQRVKPHPNLALVFAVNSAGNQGQTWEREKQWVEQWTDLTDNFYQYDIFWLGGWSLGLPAPVTQHGVEKMRFLLDSEMSGGYLYIAPSYEMLGALHYIVAKMMWDPTVDPAAVEQDYYQGLYGPAAADVKAWYDLLEQRLRAVKLEGEQPEEPVLRDLIAAGSRSRDAGETLAAYWPVLDQLQAIIDRAQARELTPEQRQRLERLVDHHNLLRTTVTAYLSAERLTRTARWDADEVAAMKAAIDERAALQLKIAQYAPSAAELLEGLDTRETAPITPEAAAYQIAGRAGPTILWTTPVAEAPELDGKADGPWREATWKPFVDNRSGAAPGRGAKAAMLLGPDALYLFVDGWDEDGSRLIADVQQRNNPALFSGDCVEWFIAPPGGGYYQIGLGAGGAVYTRHHPTGVADVSAEWNPDARAAVVRHEHGWRVEAKVPLDAFGTRPTPGAEGWTANLYRVRRGSAEPDEYTAVSPTFAGHHVASKFGAMRFGTPDDAARIVNGDIEGIDAERFEKVFRARADGNATIGLADDFAYEGQQSIQATVGEAKEGEATLASMTVTSPASAGRAYRITFAHRNSDTKLNPAVRPEGPTTRVIFRDQGGQAVTDTKGYDWTGVPLQRQEGEWRLYAHTITTPPGTEQISFTVFLHHPGEYRLDDFRIEALQ